MVSRPDDQFIGPLLFFQLISELTELNHIFLEFLCLVRVQLLLMGNLLNIRSEQTSDKETKTFIKSAPESNSVFNNFETFLFSLLVLFHVDFDKLIT